MIPTFTLAMLAIGALWASGGATAPMLRRHGWMLGLAASLIAAVATGIVRPIGLLWLVALAAAILGFRRPGAGPAQLALTALAILALTAGLMLHRLPGFENPRVISAVRFTPDAIPYTLYLNYDKTFAGILLLGGCHARIARAADGRTMLRETAPWALGLIVVVMMLSLAAGYVRFEPKFPPQTWLWLWANLCLTCLAEEALFRGFIQARLQAAWKNIPRGSWLALGVAAILFGVAHAAGGWTYVGLATAAGLGYGWVYRRTGRIEASMLTHFTLNAAHFLLFTYPALQR